MYLVTSGVHTVTLDEHERCSPGITAPALMRVYRSLPELHPPALDTSTGAFIRTKPPVDTDPQKGSGLKVGNLEAADHYPQQDCLLRQSWRNTLGNVKQKCRWPRGVFDTPRGRQHPLWQRAASYALMRMSKSTLPFGAVVGSAVSLVASMVTASIVPATLHRPKAEAVS